MYFLLNGIIAFFILVYSAIWFAAPATLGSINNPYSSSVMDVSYKAGEEEFTETFMRYDVDLRAREVTVSYLPFNPSSARIRSFMGIAAEPLGWWVVILLASTMLLFTDNFVFSKGTEFRLQKKFPWIWMDEFYRLPWYYRNDEDPEERVRTGRQEVRKLKDLEEG